MDQDHNKVAFGYEAENEYAELLTNDEHHDYYYFTRFKMCLYETKKLSKDMIIHDISGKPMAAIDVFSLSIRALKEHLYDTLKRQVPDIDSTDIRWVLTVPAMWSENAKQFMRRSAEKAGIEPERLRIALEPEAASIFCQHVPLDKLNDKNSVTVASTGTKYAVVDVGGGTADITVHEKMNDGSLHEVCCASGNGCGGTSVDTAFFDFLKEIIGNEAMESLKTEHLEEYLDILREFEMKKRSFRLNKKDVTYFRIPVNALDAIVSSSTIHKTLKDALKASKHANDVIVHKDKLKIDSQIFRSLFDSTVYGIVHLLHSMLKDGRADWVSQIILVGGFSGSQLLQEAIKKTFPEQQLIVPCESELSVVKGAVIFGHRPDIISERISKYTYGFSKRKRFDPAIHDENHLEVVNGEQKCCRVFDQIIRKYERIPYGKRISSVAKTKPDKDEYFTLRIYQSEKQEPIYTDEEGCSVLGEIKIKRVNPNTTETIKVVLKFGETEINVKILEKDHNTATLDTIEMI